MRGCLAPYGGGSVCGAGVSRDLGAAQGSAPTGRVPLSFITRAYRGGTGDAGRGVAADGTGGLADAASAVPANPAAASVVSANDGGVKSRREDQPPWDGSDISALTAVSAEGIEVITDGVTLRAMEGVTEEEEAPRTEKHRGERGGDVGGSLSLGDMVVEGGELGFRGDALGERESPGCLAAAEAVAVAGVAGRPLAIGAGEGGDGG